ncbi:MAG: LacI family DNA-binding transcriptional regulator [Opitutales bacterium]|nr:LacI family DNA-binding transcriptional regulator [Opitutales bacterium]
MQNKDIQDFGEASGPHYRDFANELKTYVAERGMEVGQRFPTIRQLVKRSGHSLSTVHKALGILEDEGLLEARHGSGYYIKSLPAGFRKNGRRELLVLIPYFVKNDEYWFTGKIIEGMLFAAQDRNVTISFERYPEGIGRSKEKQEELYKIIEEKKPDGVVWLHARGNRDVALVRRIQALGCKVVTTIRRIGDLDIPVLRDDEYAFSSQVLSAFKFGGHRKVGLFIHDEKDDYYKARIEALRETAEMFGLAIPSSAIVSFSGSEPELETEKVRAYFRENSDVTGLLVLYTYAIHNLKEVMETSPEIVPDALAVVFNVLSGVEIPSLPAPWDGLSKVSPPLYKLGQELVFTLLAAIDEKPYSVPRLVPNLELGSSMRAAAGQKS